MECPSKPSKATKFNAFTLKKLQRAFESDSEVDLTMKLPMDYSDRLENWRSVNVEDYNKAVRPHEEDIRAALDGSVPIETIYPLSQSVLDLLESQPSGSTSDSFSQRLIRMIQSSEVIWKGPSADYKMVFKCNPCIVLKAVRASAHYSNSGTPRPFTINGIALIFMSYQPGSTLSNVWPTLDKAQKSSIQEQLNKILTDLRSLPFSPGTLLGGIGGEGCKDIRRHLRRKDGPTMTVDEFEQFLFTGYRAGGDAFMSLMNDLRSSAPCKVVFTHGDLRPDNITVELVGDHDYIVSGLIDWEYSGFYPEYYEAAKITNCLTPYEENDWYLFLPDCVSPKRYAQWWFFDRVRRTRVL